jgi:hypothetical protein
MAHTLGYMLAAKAAIESSHRDGTVAERSIHGVE